MSISSGLDSVLCAVDCEGYGTVDYSGVDRVTAPYTEKNHFILLFPLLCSECSINWGVFCTQSVVAGKGNHLVFTTRLRCTIPRLVFSRTATWSQGETHVMIMNYSCQGMKNFPALQFSVLAPIAVVEAQTRMGRLELAAEVR